MFAQIKKRDGSIAEFSLDKVISAVEKTMSAINLENEELALSLANKIVEAALLQFGDNHLITIEEMQDTVEKVLIKEGYAEMAKAFILYRQKRSELRKLKENILGRMDDSILDVNGLLIAKTRYLLKDENGNTSESPKEMFRRVAKAISTAEKNYKKDPAVMEKTFYDIISTLEFIPAGRILANAGTKNKMLYSSFVIPIEDSMKGIFRAFYDKALVQRLGGGTGFSFSKLRPKGSKLHSSENASGPVAFIKLFDHAADLTVMGTRKAANMGSLSVEHPDIIEFITMKERGEIRNFNISVEITENFMDAIKTNGTYNLIDPNTGKTIDIVDANNIFLLIVTMAWKTGDPGILFIDRINATNPLPELGRIETTDPCGDQLLLPYEGGNLGAINLSLFTKHKKMQWKRLEEVVRIAVRFLDNTVDIARFPSKKIDDMVKGTRRIGLGVTGFADMLYRLRIPYNSDKAVEIADKTMKFIFQTAKEESEKLATERGAYPLNKKSKIRNSSMIAIAPCGSRSILANTSAGIEPNFGLGYIRKILGSDEILQVNSVLEEALKENNLYSEELIRKIVKTGSIRNLELPEELKQVFVTAYEISPEWHIKIQAAFQKNVDNAISKTINFPRSATIEEVKKAFLLAYDMGCKGLTVYREGSLKDQVISFG